MTRSAILPSLALLVLLALLGTALAFPLNDDTRSALDRRAVECKEQCITRCNAKATSVLRATCLTGCDAKAPCASSAAAPLPAPTPSPPPPTTAPPPPSATPPPPPATPPPPPPPASSPPAAGACTVTSSTGFAACLTSTNILIKGPFTVPAETTIDMSKLKAGTKVTVSGVITWAKSTSLTKDNFLFTLGGSGITFDGTGATFNGNGQLYWDGQGANGGVPKPKFFKVLTTGNSVIKGIKILNSPIHIFSIGGSDTTLQGITVDNTAGDAGGGHNTDAFDVSATGVTIQDCFVQNQDDCLAVNMGSNIKFLRNYCSGGHGISIGSIASNKVVSGVTVDSCTIVNSDNGVRIKTISGATGGSVSDVTYNNITLSNIAKYGVVIEQDYLNGGPTGTPTGGIPISGVTLSHVVGTVSAKAKQSIYILCAACSKFTFTDVNITPASPKCSGISPLPQGC